MSRHEIKTALFVFCLVGIVRGESDSASGTPDELRAAISGVLKREFKFDPHPGVGLPTSDAAVLVLPRLEVIDTLRGIDRVVRQEQKKKDDERFSWKMGGTIWERGRGKVMFKYDPATGSLYFLKVSW